LLIEVYESFIDVCGPFKEVYEPFIDLFESLRDFFESPGERSAPSPIPFVWFVPFVVSFPSTQPRPGG